MMKALRPALTAGECRDILQKTSYDIPEPGSQWYEPGGCGRVADIDRALEGACARAEDMALELLEGREQL